MGLIHERVMEFFEFIYDRHLIYTKKEVDKQPFPWTEDKVLRDLSFCNVYRELDKGSRYIIEKINNDLEGNSPNEKFLNIVAYRIFNKYNWFEEVGIPYFDMHNFQFQEYLKKLDEFRSQGGTLFSTAYMISAARIDRRTEEYRHVKHYHILKMLERLATELKNDPHYIKNKIYDKDPLKIIKNISRIPIVGPFLAGQILVDMTYFDLLFGLTNDDFLVVGPGSGPTICYMLDDWTIDYQTKYKYMTFLRDHQTEYFSELKKKTGKDFNEICDFEGRVTPDDVPVPMMDIQNCGCEFRKYTNLKKGKGKRRKFRPSRVEIEQV